MEALGFCKSTTSLILIILALNDWHLEDHSKITNE